MVLSEQSIMEQQPVYFKNTSSSSSHQKVAFDDDTTSPIHDYEIPHTILWCLCSALFTILLKRLLESFPYPLTIASVVLGTQMFYSALKWTCLPPLWLNNSSNRRTSRRRPSFRRFKRRHWYKLMPAALSHGVGSILNMYTALLGPVATSVLMQLLPRPFWSGTPFPAAQLVLCGVMMSSISKSATLEVSEQTEPSTSSRNYYIYIVQVVIGLLANLAFVARSRIRISTHRFNGAQNVFEVTCAMSVVGLIVPLTWFVDGASPFLYLLLEVSESNPRRFLQLLCIGILYCINNELTFVVVKQPAVLRRAVSWVAAIFVWTPQRYLEILGGLLVFGATWYHNYVRKQQSARGDYTSSGTMSEQHDLPPVRDRTLSTDSYTSLGSCMSYNSLRALDRG